MGERATSKDCFIRIGSHLNLNAPLNSGGHGYKFRPVIVLATRSDGTLVAMVTGSGNKLSLEHDYPIREWKAAGLDKPSIARLDRIAEIPAGYLGSAGRIGRLADGDIVAIKTMLIEIARSRG